MKSEIILTALQWLAILACPLMMLWCMRGMSDRGSRKPDRPDPPKTPAGSGELGNPEAEIRELKARLARLEKHPPETGS
ncbi:MAG: DUF2933 domain-containing protein [Gemmatimonadales bacterium]